MNFLKHDEREKLMRLVNELFEPSNRYSEHTSYHIKHILERITGFYMSNDEMKSIMIELGYYPNSKTERNPRYKVKFKKL